MKILLLSHDEVIKLLPMAECVALMREALVSLAEARDALRGADEQTLIEFVAARVADARGRDAARRDASMSVADARPLRAAPPVYKPAPTAITATIVPLGGNAMCIIPAAHDALRNPADARALVDALATAVHAREMAKAAA